MRTHRPQKNRRAVVGWLLGVLFAVLVAGLMLFIILTAKPAKTEQTRAAESLKTEQLQVETFDLNVNEQSIVGPKPVPQAEPTLTFLRDILADVCNKAGISFRSLARKKYDVKVAVKRRTTLRQVLTQTAAEAGLPFIEDDPNGLDKGTCEVVLTDVAVYAGNDDKVIELLNNMGSNDPEVRSESTEFLGDYEKASFEPVLTLMLRDDQAPEVRASAAIALEQAKQTESIDLLIKSLSDSDKVVREHARATLGVIGGENVYERLYETLDTTEDTEVREIIEQILEEVFNEPLFID